jgi:2-oxoglutarate ferredoxin oxidoreductase subunit beta
MTVLFKKTRALTNEPTIYCPGCSHGIIQRLVAEVLDELDLLDMTIGIAAVGCSVLSYSYFNCDMLGAAHGRAPASATGIKRVHPGKTVFTYQGDGDLASIGTAEIIHAAVRGEKITAVFVNNATYGMTGGQMAPTSLLGQKTSTSPDGRKADRDGMPIRMSEMLATIDGAAFVERVAVNTPAHIHSAKQAIRQAFETQQAGQGFSIVEVLSSCPTNWQLSPVAAMQWVEDQMIPYYPLKNFRKPEEAR